MGSGPEDVAGAVPHTVRVAASDLEASVAGCFAAAGVPEPDAGAVAAALVYADLRGIESHGVHRVPAYLRRVRAGLAGGTERMTRESGSGAVARYDAGFALGPAAATRAVDEAVALAGEHGIGLVGLRRSTHLGAAGYYGWRVARRDLVGVVLSNGPSAVAPHGAAARFLGTNPLAIGVPLGRQGEFVLDMSTAALARERIRMAAAEGRPLEPGSAIDAEGRPTTDPLAALAGSVLPFGGAKGSGLGIAISLLVVMLSGAEADDEIGSMYRDFDRPQDVGQVFVVVDPWRLAPRARMQARLEALVERLRGLPALPDGPGAVRLPGDRAAEVAAARARDGVPVEAAVLTRIAEACAECGLPGPAARFHDLARRGPVSRA